MGLEVEGNEAAMLIFRNHRSLGTSKGDSSLLDRYSQAPEMRSKKERKKYSAFKIQEELHSM